MVTITRHLFINVFFSEHISAVKFDTGYENNKSFLVIPKSLKVRQKVEKIGLSSFNIDLGIFQIYLTTLIMNSSLKWILCQHRFILLCFISYFTLLWNKIRRNKFHYGNVCYKILLWFLSNCRMYFEFWAISWHNTNTLFRTNSSRTFIF